MQDKNINFIDSANDKFTPKTAEDYKKLKIIRDKIDQLDALKNPTGRIQSSNIEIYNYIPNTIDAKIRNLLVNNNLAKHVDQKKEYYYKNRFYLAIGGGLLFSTLSYLGARRLKTVSNRINPVLINLLLMNFVLVPSSLFVYWSYMNLQKSRVESVLEELDERPHKRTVNNRDMP